MKSKVTQLSLWEELEKQVCIANDYDIWNEKTENPNWTQWSKNYNINHTKVLALLIMQEPEKDILKIFNQLTRIRNKLQKLKYEQK